MNAEMFPKWLGAIRLLTRDRRRETVTMVALSETGDDPDWALSDAFAAVSDPAAAGAPMAIAPSRHGDARSASAPLARPMNWRRQRETGWKRWAVRTARLRTCGLGGTPTGCRAIVALTAGGPSAS